MDIGTVVYVGIREEAMAWSGYRVKAHVIGEIPEKVMPKRTVSRGLRIIMDEDYVERDPYNGEVREGVIAAKKGEVFAAHPRYIEDNIDDLVREGELTCFLMPEGKDPKYFMNGVLLTKERAEKE